MGKCTCYEERASVRKIAKTYGFELSPDHYIKCHSCCLQMQEEQRQERIIEARRAAYDHFMSLPEHPDRWDEVFNYIYERGYNP